jgi:prophage regulatory protein
MIYLTDRDVAKRFSVHRCTIWRWTCQGDFPKPVKLGGTTTRWRLSEIETWEMQTVEGISQSATPQ